MKAKEILLFFAVFVALAAIIISTALKETRPVSLDSVYINDTVKTLSENWAEIQKTGSLPSIESQFDYTVLDGVGSFIAATRRGLSESINDAIRNRDTIVDIIIDGEIVGKAIIHNDTAEILKQNRTRLIWVSVLVFAVLITAFTMYTLYLYFAIIRPFRKLQGFARHIAAGNFDVPLEMDRRNLFGSFTESFDLMREELNKAKENERNAEQSKKELVASLSHDIKTPVASIKAVTEYMLVTSKDEEDKKQLEIINMKAEQINSLITNMFHATLEELQSLRVTPAEVQSAAIAKLIKNSDYKGNVKPFSLPDCIISADLQRLQQVFDNIISNSYKYAGTDIEISTAFEGAYLTLSVSDFGTGVPKEELPLVFNKFFRGKNSDGANGYGLGLYISKYLIEQMSGEIQCENRSNGFCVRLRLRLA